MTTLADIKQSISQMSDEELEARIRGIRSRRDAEAPNTSAKAKTKSTAKKKAPEADLMKLFSSLSAEQQADLLSSLGKGA